MAFEAGQTRWTVQPQFSNTEGALCTAGLGRQEPQARSVNTLAAVDAFLLPPHDPNPHCKLSRARSARAKSLIPHSSSASVKPSIRRKPLSTTASQLTCRFFPDHFHVVAQKAAQRYTRPPSIDSPTLYEFQGDNSQPVGVVDALTSSPTASVAGAGPADSPPCAHQSTHSSTHAPSLEPRQSIPDSGLAASPTCHARLQEHGMKVIADRLSTQQLGFGQLENSAPESLAVPDCTARGDFSMSLFTRKTPPTHIHLELATTDDCAQAVTTHSDDCGYTNSPQSRSPSSASQRGQFDGWRISHVWDKDALSPLQSPLSTKPTTAALSPADACSASAQESNITPDSHGLDAGSLDYCEAYLGAPPDSTISPSSDQLGEMEEELRAIGQELASSIRREMDLEDLVDRLQEQINNSQGPGKRMSDYFSDSGYSSAKSGDYEQAKDEISHIQRRAEQDKAQVRLELTEKLQHERGRRRLLDQQILELSKRAAQVDITQTQNNEDCARVKELERQCEDLRRKLWEERELKNNMDELMSALKIELQNASNERDNLRDEIVPQLRARVEGLEAEASESAKMAYDATKMQQELDSLKLEKSGLKALESGKSLAPSGSASIAGKYSKVRPRSLTRSNMIRSSEARDALAERLKDVEAQRDALHSALRNLLDRQEFQSRENLKKIKALESERDRLLGSSPKKAGYEKDVADLREEINILRRRAEDAIEQKWQVEKGLAGLKMDLDRAEEEVMALRQLLKASDILVPESLARASNANSSTRTQRPITLASLEKALLELQQAYAGALERITTEASSGSDDKIKLASDRVHTALASAVSERDLAKSEAEALRDQVESLQAHERTCLSTERDLADQLRESFRRVEELTQQVRTQLATNASLRARLTDAVARGEADQRASKKRIAQVQARLHSLELQVIASQTAAEELVGRHESELATLRENHHVQLQRLRDATGSLRSPRSLHGNSPLSPMFAMRSSLAEAPRTPSNTASGGPNHILAPNIADRAISGQPSTAMANSTTPTDAAQVTTLQVRVTELEASLAMADEEMQEVVGRMNEAQIQVLTLQEECEAAVRETRKLQRAIDEENVRAFNSKFKAITTEVP